MERVASLSVSQRPGRLRTELRRHGPYLCCGFGVLAAAESSKARLLSLNADDAGMAVLSFVIFTPMLLPALLPMLFFRIAVFDRAPSPGRALAAEVKRFLFADGRLLSGCFMLLAVVAFMTGFAVFKALIPYIRPFAWDATFDSWERWLHFGYRPWELLQPLLGHPLVTTAISINYSFWFVSLSMYWLHFAFEERPGVLRSQAMLAFLLTWSIGGVLLATLLSSAGPCFYGKLDLGSDPYAGLMDYLHGTARSFPVWALDIQDTLWSNYSSTYGQDIAKGISAMPSMHNAQALLLVFAVWKKHPLVRGLAMAHGGLVFLGSIHLGWHYAVDGYLAFAIAGAAWLVAGLLARAWEGRRLTAAALPR